MKIQPYDDSQLDEIVRFSLRSWEPVFKAVEKAMDPEIYAAQYPAGWREAQKKAVESACADADVSVWVAMRRGDVVGFEALTLHREDSIGEVYMIAVDPDHQRRGIAAALISHSLAWFKQAGMTTAMIQTGADPGHAPARRTYESAGFQLLPAAQYFKKL